MRHTMSQMSNDHRFGAFIGTFYDLQVQSSSHRCGRTWTRGREPRERLTPVNINKLHHNVTFFICDWLTVLLHHRSFNYYAYTTLLPYTIYVVLKSWNSNCTEINCSWDFAPLWALSDLQSCFWRGGEVQHQFYSPIIIIIIITGLLSNATVQWNEIFCIVKCTSFIWRMSSTRTKSTDNHLRQNESPERNLIRTRYQAYHDPSHNPNTVRTKMSFVLVWFRLLSDSGKKRHKRWEVKTRDAHEKRRRKARAN